MVYTYTYAKQTCGEYESATQTCGGDIFADCQVRTYMPHGEQQLVQQPSWSQPAHNQQLIKNE